MYPLLHHSTSSLKQRRQDGAELHNIFTTQIKTSQRNCSKFASHYRRSRAMCAIRCFLCRAHRLTVCCAAIGMLRVSMLSLNWLSCSTLPARTSAPHNAAALWDELCVAMGTIATQDQIRQQVTSASSHSEVHVVTLIHMCNMQAARRCLVCFILDVLSITCNALDLLKWCYMNKVWLISLIDVIFNIIKLVLHMRK